MAANEVEGQWRDVTSPDNDSGWRDIGPTPSMGMSPNEKRAMQILRQKELPQIRQTSVWGPQDMSMPYSQPVWDQWSQGSGPQMTTGALLGTIGSVAGFGLAGPLGAMALGALGSAGGEALGKVHQMQARGVPVTPGPVLDTAKSAAVWDLAGGALGSGVGRVARGAWLHADRIPGIERVGRKLRESSKRIKTRPDQFALPSRAGQMAKRGGWHLTAAQQTENPLVDTLESVAESSYGGGKNLFQMKRVIGPPAYHQMATDVVDDFWKQAGRVYGPDEVAEMLARAADRGMSSLKDDFARNLTKGLKSVPESQLTDVAESALKTSNKAWRKVGSQKYQAIDRLLKSKGRPVTRPRVVTSKVLDESGRPIRSVVQEQSWDIVDTKPIKQLAKTLSAEHRGNLGSSPGIRRIASDVIDRPRYVSLTDADRMRSDILEEARKLETSLGSRSPKLSRVTGKLEDAIDRSIKVAADKQTPAISSSINQARALWAENSQLYNTRFVQGLATKAKAGNVNALISHVIRPGSPEKIIIAKRVLGKEAFDQIRDTWLKRQIEDSLTSQKSIGNELMSRLNKVGNETLDAMVGPQQRKDLYNIARSFANMGKRGFENTMWREAIKAAGEDSSVRSNFIKNLVQPKSVKTIRAMKRNLSNKEMAAVRALWVQDAVDRYAGKGGYDSVGLYVDSLGKALNDLGPVRNELFTKSHVQDLYDLAKAGVVMGRPTGGGGGILAPLMEAGAVAGLVARPTKTAASAVPVLGGFKLLSLVFGDARATRFLLEGVKNPRMAQIFAQRAVAEIVKTAGRSLGTEGRKKRTRIEELESRMSGRSDLSRRQDEQRSIRSDLYR